MTVDPRWSFFLSLGISILNFLAGSTTQFVAMWLEQSTITAILALVTLVTGIASLINTALAAIPSKDAHTGFYLAPGPKP